MFKRSFDKYCLNRLEDEIKEEMLVWDLDYRFSDRNDMLFLEVKYRELNNSRYKTILSIRKSKALLYLANIISFREEVQKHIKEYTEVVERNK